MFVCLNILSKSENINISEYPWILCKIIFAMKGVSSMLGGYWFLNSLFFGSIFFYLSRKVKINLIFQGIILFLFSIFLNYFKDHIHVWNFNWLNFYAAFFIWSGHYYKTNMFNIHKSFKFILFSGLLIAIVCMFWHSSMTNCPYWGMPIYALSAISGTLMIFGISNYIKDFKNKLIELLVYIGGYTFNILTWHFISMKLVSLAIIIIYQQPISRLSEFPVIKEYSEYGYWVIYTTIGVTMPTIGTYVYHKMINSKVSYIKKYILETINNNK